MLLTQTAFLGHVLDDVVKLILGDGYLRVAFDEAGGKVADGGQEHGKRLKQPHEDAQAPRNGERDGFTVLFRNALRQHFAGEEYHEGRDEGADRDCSTDVAAACGNKLRHGYGDDRCGADVNDVGAYEDRGYCTVEVIKHPKGFLCTTVSAVGSGFDAHFRNGGYRGLRQSEICGKKK